MGKGNLQVKRNLVDICNELISAEGWMEVGLRVE